MDSNSEAFCEELARLFPDVASVLSNHLADNDELLPHVFMGDVTRYVLSDPPSRQALVNHLDEALREGGTDLQELVAVSFVENLESSEELERALKGIDARTIREEWHRQHRG